MTPKKIPLQSLRLTERRKKLKEFSGKEYSKIKNFIDKSKNGENNRGIDIQEATERKYIDCFNMAYKNVKKPLLELTKNDLTKLKQDLKSGKIKSRLNQSYSPTSQREMEIILIRFLEFTNPEKYSGFRKWFVVNVPKKSVEYLKEEEIEKLFKACKTNSERFLIAVLFDSGFRASEFLNLRYSEIEEPTSSFPYYKFNVKTEYSKTEGRNIGMYWKHSTEAIKDYLNEFNDKKPNDLIYPKTYDSIRIFLTRLGKRVLSKRVHFHIFRKSSATFYAYKLKSRQQLCYRYGWKFSSDIPDVYISRVQGEEEVKESMLDTDLDKLKKENQELKTRFDIGQEERGKEIDQLKNQMKEVLGIVEKEQIKYIQEAPTKKERDKLRKEFLNYDNRR